MDADNVPVRVNRQGLWWKALLSGFILWIATIVVTATTHSTSLIPTLILLGSFLVPFCVVLFAVERTTGTLSSLDVFMAFFIGGAFGVLGASLLEANLEDPPWVYARVGLVEEFVKGLILVVLGRAVTPKTAVQGGLLGASVGAGFAAFESAGYSFNAAVTANGIDLASLLQAEATRSILAPVCHILWTALLGAVIFGAARGSTRYRLTGGVLVAFVGVVVLHTLWDAMQNLAGLLAEAASGHSGPGNVAAAESASLSMAFYVSGLVIVAVTGLASLGLALRENAAPLSRRRAEHPDAPTQDPGAPAQNRDTPAQDRDAPAPE